MGLQEKKWRRTIEEEYVAEFKADLSSHYATAFDVTFDWESFSSVDELKFVPTYSLDRVKSALRTLAEDQDAKEEIEAQIKTLHIRNVENGQENKAMALSDGTFDFAAGFGGNHNDVFTDLAIREFLEGAL
ncbi:hypothetical protein [Microbulbifer aggregans]|uniref:hypothetical protein n=1 Tax=Microbulbifer aggregans TaxID=1769779 RepID=UPI001CFDFE5F|nr:hypothetical protein [Microbulbifer aggregans]